jgi:RNA polymerase sigma-70 factor (ECF subfamily)
MKSTQQLVDAARSGDRSAYGELVRRYERAVISTGWSILGDFHTAQDLAQEVFVAAYQHLTTLRDSASFGTWVMRIAQRKSLRLRKQAAANRPERNFMDGFPAPSDPATNELREELMRAVGQLPEHERLVVVLRYLDGHSVEAVANLSGRSVGTVTKQLSRAMQRLRHLTRRVSS